MLVHLRLRRLVNYLNVNYSYRQCYLIIYSIQYGDLQTFLTQDPITGGYNIFATKFTIHTYNWNLEVILYIYLLLGFFDDIDITKFFSEIKVSIILKCIVQYINNRHKFLIIALSIVKIGLIKKL